MTRRNRRTRNKSIKRSSRKVRRSIRKDINLDRKGRRSIRKDRRSSRKVIRSTRKVRRSSRKDRRSSRKRRTSKKLRRRVGGSAGEPMLQLEDVKVVRWWEPYLENAGERKKELNKDEDKFKEDLRNLFRGLDIFCKKWDLDKDIASPISKNNCIMAKGVVDLEDWSPHDEKPWINPKGLYQIIYVKDTPPPVKEILQDVLDLPREKPDQEKWREWEVGIRHVARRLNKGEGVKWKLASNEALGHEAISLGAHVAEKVLTEDVFVDYVVKITKDKDQDQGEGPKDPEQQEQQQALLDARRESGATVEKQGDADETLSGKRNNILTFIEEMFHQNFTAGVVEGAEGVILEEYKNLNNLSNCLVDDCEHRDMVKEFIQKGKIDTKGFLKELNTEVDEGEAASIYSLTKNKSTGVTKSSITGSSPDDDKTKVGRQRIKKNSQMEDKMPELFVTEKGDVPDKPEIKDVIIQKYLYYSVYKKFKDENESVVTQDPIEIGKRIVERLLSEAEAFEGDLEKDILYKVISMGNCKNINIYNNELSDNPNDDKKITDTQVTRNLLNARFNNKYQLEGDKYVESDPVPIVNLLNDINIKVANLDSNDFGWIKGEFTNEGGEVEGSATLSIVVANADLTAAVPSGDNEEAKSPPQNVTGALAKFDEDMVARQRKRESEPKRSLAEVAADQARDDVILGKAKLALGASAGESLLEKRLASRDGAEAAKRFRRRKQLLLEDRARPENSGVQTGQDAVAEEAEAETQSRGPENSGVQTGQEDAVAEEAAAAAKIQAVERGRRGRLSAADLRKRAEEAAAKDAAAAAAAKKKAAAATKIQAAQRGRRDREKAAALQLQNDYAYKPDAITAGNRTAVELLEKLQREERAAKSSAEVQRTREARDKLESEVGLRSPSSRPSRPKG